MEFVSSVGHSGRNKRSRRRGYAYLACYPFEGPAGQSAMAESRSLSLLLLLTFCSLLVPPSHTYNTGAGPVPGKLNVHLVPHTHDDLGWLVTADEYYVDEVQYILHTIVQELQWDPNRKFSYVETV